ISLLYRLRENQVFRHCRPRGTKMRTATHYVSCGGGREKKFFFYLAPGGEVACGWEGCLFLSWFSEKESAHPSPLQFKSQVHLHPIDPGRRRRDIIGSEFRADVHLAAAGERASDFKVLIEQAAFADRRRWHGRTRVFQVDRPDDGHAEFGDCLNEHFG